MIFMLTNIDPSVLIAAATLIVSVIVHLIGFGRVMGRVSMRLDSHQEQHIRHQTRLDEHAQIISKHERDLAVIKDRTARSEHV